MKILWLCNTLFEDVAKELKIKSSKPESWILGVYKQLITVDTELVYLFPDAENHISYKVKNCQFVSYIQKKPKTFEKNQIIQFENILKEYKPDVIHIFGTEYPHSLAMLKAADNVGILYKCVLNIQGIVSAISECYFKGLSRKVIHSYTFRDLLRKDNIYHQKKDFEKRSKYEKEAIELCEHVIGRTDFDKEFVTLLNPSVKYHFCNETLRDSFYINEWEKEKCEKHSIFVSQCSYTIKGFHYMLKAMADVVKTYPDAVLYTTGKNPLELSLKQKLRQGSYNKYVGKLIKKYHLENNIRFLGFLTEDKMCSRYLSTNVFVSPSVIENSPNSLGEAMILGVPCIASMVGGVGNMLEHSKEGYLYRFDAIDVLSGYIKTIFENEKLAVEFSVNAKKRAADTHNRQKNFDRLLEIYKEISK